MINTLPVTISRYLMSHGVTFSKSHARLIQTFLHYFSNVQFWDST